VGALAHDARAQEITRSIVALAHKLGCGVIAEGVEGAGQAALLDAWSCDQQQGYLYARPMSADDAADLVRRGGSGEALRLAS